MSKLSKNAVRVQLQDMTETIKEAMKDLTIAEKEWFKEEKKKGL